MPKKLQYGHISELLSIAGILTIVISLFTCWSLIQIIKTNHHQRVSNLLQNQVDEVVQDVQFADISQLKYFVTGSELYRDNYLEAKNKTQSDLMEFFDLGQQEREDFVRHYGEIKDIVEEYFDRTDSYIAMRDRDAGFRPEVVAHEIDGDLIRRLSRLGGVLIDRENAAFSMHEMSINEDAKRTGFGILVTSLLCLGILIYTVFVNRREVRSRAVMSDELQTAQQNADRASRVRNQFYAVISHELRTPLNGIIGISDLLKDKLNTEEQRDYLKIIRESGNSLLKMVNDLLNISKIESGHLDLEIKEFALPEIVNQVTSLVGLRAKEKGLFLETHLDSKIACRYFGDSERIKQVLMNLLTNSVKYTEHGGVRFRVRLKQSAGPGQAIVRFEVEDTGVGIKESDRETIFAPFQQIRGNGAHAEGVGLGLAITKNLVELMRGEINLISEPKKGTLFWVDLPLRVAGDWVQKSEAKRLANLGVTFKESPAELSTKPRKILVAEDNDTNRLLIEAYLRKMGCELKMATNGAECQEFWAEESFDAILMDCGMPVMDGYEATRRIRQSESAKNLPPIPIIALTAHAMEEEREKCLAVGMTDYLSKPFTFAEFRDVLERHLKPTTESKPAPPQDLEVYENLIQETGEDTARVLMRSFQKTLVKAQAELEEALVGDQRDRIRQACHWMRSSAQMLGFQSIATVAEKIERDIREETYRRQDVTRLVTEIQAALTTMAAEPASGNPPLSQSQS